MIALILYWYKTLRVQVYSPGAIVKTYFGADGHSATKRQDMSRIAKTAMSVVYTSISRLASPATAMPCSKPKYACLSCRSSLHASFHTPVSVAMFAYMPLALSYQR
jgi:hypothetical protein